jgi:hypothetical protein
MREHRLRHGDDYEFIPFQFKGKTKIEDTETSHQCLRFSEDSIYVAKPLVYGSVKDPVEYGEAPSRWAAGIFKLDCNLQYRILLFYVQVFQNKLFYVKNKGKFIVLEKLDCNLQYIEFLILLVILQNYKFSLIFYIKKFILKNLIVTCNIDHHQFFILHYQFFVLLVSLTKIEFIDIFLLLEGEFLLFPITYLLRSNAVIYS